MNQSDNFDLPNDAHTTTQGRNRDNLFSWCDLAAGLQAIRGQWKAPILIALAEEPCNVPALQHRLALVNRRVLVRAMRELEKDSLIRKSSISSYYLLTSDGAAVVKILHKIAQWQVNRSGKSS